MNMDADVAFAASHVDFNWAVSFSAREQSSFWCQSLARFDGRLVDGLSLVGVAGEVRRLYAELRTERHALHATERFLGAHVFEW